MKKINSNLLIKILLFQIFIVLVTFTNAHAYIGLGPLLPMIGGTPCLKTSSIKTEMSIRMRKSFRSSVGNSVVFRRVLV